MATVALNPDEVEAQNLSGVALPGFWRGERTSQVRSTREWWAKVLAPKLYGAWEEAKLDDHKARLIRSVSLGLSYFCGGWFVVHSWGVI